jgi:hypothetical protein
VATPTRGVDLLHAPLQRSIGAIRSTWGRRARSSTRFSRTGGGQRTEQQGFSPDDGRGDSGLLTAHDHGAGAAAEHWIPSARSTPKARGTRESCLTRQAATLLRRERGTRRGSLKACIAARQPLSDTPLPQPRGLTRAGGLALGQLQAVAGSCSHKALSLRGARLMPSTAESTGSLSPSF